MSITATKTDYWYMDEPDCQVEVRSKEEDGRSVLQWRDHFVLKLSRKIVGLTSFTSETRDIRTSFTARTSASITITWMHTGRQFFCTQHNCPIQDAITGDATESQTWEHYTDWEDIPGTVLAAVGP